ncbi:MAG: pseudouridine synthase [Terriglobales bacterium]
MQERLQKLISQAGVASRRKAEVLITTGQVTVNGLVIAELGSKADWVRDHITVAGKPVRPAARLHHLLFYKPKGVVTTLSDPEGRPTIADFVRSSRERIYPVGRLDFHSEGLLVLTNDGALANRVLHASTALPKTYWVKVAGRPGEEQLARLRRGVVIEGRRTAPAQIRWLAASGASGRERQRAGVYRTSSENPWLEVVLIEGRYHQIRKMFALIGHPVEKLKRVAIGPLRIGQLKPGQMRELTPPEIAQLRTAHPAAGRTPASLPGGGPPVGSVRPFAPAFPSAAARPPFSGRPPVAATPRRRRLGGPEGRAAAEIRWAATRARSAPGASKLPRSAPDARPMRTAGAAPARRAPSRGPREPGRGARGSAMAARPPFSGRPPARRARAAQDASKLPRPGRAPTR